MASFRFRWLSSDIVESWPSASSPSNIQPSAPDSSAYATLRRLSCTGLFGRGNLAAGELAVARVLYADGRSRDGADGVEEGDPLAPAASVEPPVEACLHECTAIDVERRQRVEGADGRRGPHIFLL